MILTKLLIDNPFLNFILKDTEYYCMRRGDGINFAFKCKKAEDTEKIYNMFNHYLGIKPKLNQLDYQTGYIFLSGKEIISKCFYLFFYTEILKVAGWKDLFDDDMEYVGSECLEPEANIDKAALRYSEQFIENHIIYKKYMDIKPQIIDNNFYECGIKL